LSQHWPGRDSDWRIPWRFNSSVNWADVYCDPRMLPYVSSGSQLLVRP